MAWPTVPSEEKKNRGGASQFDIPDQERAGDGEKPAAASTD